ncbi:Serpin (serine protease inhibitor) [Maioricimonas rarisocia]|uniref:Serpin (Serine protease inhibitor) n=1 Tax=Maioricimonas rarisocia TaxID=2528026 RepID=A0A517Z2U6_9PLAN|nr:serpin family protein [Maioricimonas rarisocia]QDU36801.1 Serpin (serine protease inhibitor) [Maioricimonas rarisocia]
MSPVTRTVLLTVVAAMSWGLPGASSPAVANPLREPDQPDRMFSPTHVVTTETAYYTTGPQQGRPADGRFKVGTNVERLQDGGSYVQVRTEQGVTAWIAADASTPLRSRKPFEPDLRPLAGSVNGFAFDLYGELREREGNLFFSPASLSTALAMAWAGADGETRNEMGRVLRFHRNPSELPPERVHETYGEFTDLLNSAGAGGGYVLQTANRLWGQEGFAFLPEFRQITREHYGAELAELDFRQTESSRLAINSWVERQTREKITNLIPEGVLTPDTRLVLTNAIYFKGGWKEEFSKERTEEASFHLTSGKTINAPLMQQTEKFVYGETESVQLLRLPYAGGDVSMLIVLPRAESSLAELEQQLSGEQVTKWQRQMRRRKVHVLLPRFRMTSTFRLADVLREMGMVTAFDPQAADFSRMSRQEQLMISEVVHKAYVDVNEEGTEAAAATGIVFEPTAAPVNPEEPVEFRADRPFLFLLQDQHTGAILFLGRLSRPEGDA